VLLKSAPLPEACTLSDAQHAGLVDPYFAQAVAQVPQVSWANLRQPEPPIVAWLRKIDTMGQLSHDRPESA